MTASQTVSADELGGAIAAAVEAYTHGVEAGIPAVLDKNAREALVDLRGRSPKLTGSYAAGWRIKKETRSDTGEERRVIYNKTDYQITHLLEHGHAKRNGGRVAARPHIGPVADEHGAKLSADLGRLVVKGGI